jgi:hypothetical protein
MTSGFDQRALGRAALIAVGTVFAARFLEHAPRGSSRPNTLGISVADHVTTHEWVGVRVVRAAAMGIGELWSRMPVTPERHVPHYSSRRESLRTPWVPPCSHFWPYGLGRVLADGHLAEVGRPEAPSPGREFTATTAASKHTNAVSVLGRILVVSKYQRQERRSGAAVATRSPVARCIGFHKIRVLEHTPGEPVRRGPGERPAAVTLVVRRILVARPSAFGGARYAQLPAAKRKDPASAMLDQLRREIQIRLDELLGEADKLRRALAALGSRDGAARPSASVVSSLAPERARRRARSAPASRTATGQQGDDRRRGRHRDRAGPRKRQHHTVKASNRRSARPLAATSSLARQPPVQQTAPPAPTPSGRPDKAARLIRGKRPAPLPGSNLASPDTRLLRASWLCRAGLAGFGFSRRRELVGHRRVRSGSDLSG